VDREVAEGNFTAKIPNSFRLIEKGTVISLSEGGISCLNDNARMKNGN
jgi:hypothetical protein